MPTTPAFQSPSAWPQILSFTDTCEGISEDVFRAGYTLPSIDDDNHDEFTDRMQEAFDLIAEIVEEFGTVRPRTTEQG